jgi:hypothetical protein
MDIPKDALLEEAKKLGESLLQLMKSSVKDLWRVEDTEFLKQLAQDVANQKVAAAKADTPEKKAEHERNLKHLADTVKLEIVNRRLKIRRFRKDLFADILKTIIKTVATLSLNIAVSKIGGEGH